MNISRHREGSISRRSKSPAPLIVRMRICLLVAASAAKTFRYIPVNLVPSSQPGIIPAMIGKEDRLEESISRPLVLLFGPLPLSFDNAAFSKLRRTIVETEDHHWFLDIITNLSQRWKNIITALPSLEAGSGLKQLEDLKRAFFTDHPLETPFPLSNTLLMPLTVISHLEQYSAFLRRSKSHLDDSADLFTRPKCNPETLGLCTGFLSAVAVACAANKEQFIHYGAVAVHLSMFIGMVVDAQDAALESGSFRALSTAWSSAGGREEVLRILRDFPEAYISVNYDEHRATVTAKASTSSKLQQELKASGNIASEIALFGRFHSECYRPMMDSLSKFCDNHPEFQFLDASALATPLRSNNGGDFITEGALHHHVLQSILLEPPKWFDTFATVRNARLNDKDALLLSFGPERCIPPSLASGLGQQIVHVVDLDPASIWGMRAQRAQHPYLDNDIAVVGMSCKVAGAENLEDFWDLLCAGKSQHREVPKERFGFETAFRELDRKRKWFGNFMDDHDTFDHKFFKKSPRESATMDPQQRQLLQAAYQAIEQSGYFHSANPDKRIGCYVGVCACDYENNIACHAPNAFTATGNLKGFIAGKVSHQFGWTGPGLVIDTACSSSAVAVHQACHAIISGECNAALAAGTHVMTNPLWFQNLAGASFLSTTGQCKPFDANADGYCRGEGVATVFLKKMSAAMADGNQVIGVIAATAVQQNQNCTPIFVPNVPSLSDLFRVVTDKARLKPAQISVVEAHGTGTAVGDPAEYDSIRQVLGGSIRTEPLMLSSVKGLVGHIECTSGIVSMIKILLMIQKGKIPPQASFATLNPAIGAKPGDNMCIPTSLQPWKASFRAALINNYGASGSNASIVLTQSPFVSINSAVASPSPTATITKYPFWLCGVDDQSLHRYSRAFLDFLDRKSYSEKDFSLSNISFNAARKSNRSLDRALIFSARSVDELKGRLASYDKADPSIASIARPESKPVVLCFGGQISTFIGLDRDLYKSIRLLRKYLDEVDAVALSIGADSIFPGIFQRTPIQDTVKLQLTLFATQYACARSWIDSGIKPVAVVGHSFGELTALCISESLSLRDTLNMIINRATLVRDAWGSEKGTMMAVEADRTDVEKLLAEASKGCGDDKPASIACYNGPRSFTLAGSAAAIDVVAATVTENATFASMRTKRLNVTNAFHCALLDHLVEGLEQSAEGFRFREPTIPFHRATEFHSQQKLSPRFVADHMRFPVYFHHAICRISEQHPSCVYLEAGSNSTITSMASRALDHPSSSHFQAINITSDNAWSHLTDATLSLWKSGVNTQHWAHQISQTKDHTLLLLPPYQFDKSRHWVELKAPSEAITDSTVHGAELKVEQFPEDLLTFVGYQDNDKRIGKFRVNTMISKYDKLVAGHVIARTASICPATVQLDLAIESVQTMRPDLAAAKLEPQIHGVENQSPICIDPARALWIYLEEESKEGARLWHFQVFSTEKHNHTAKTIHTTGKIIFRCIDDTNFNLEFARFERLISHQRCVDLLKSNDAGDIIQGRSIYKTFAEIVDYGEDYRGLQKLVGRGNESAGSVIKNYNPESWLDAHLGDSFCQVGGIFVNCMTDVDPTDMFIANGIEQWVRSPKLRQRDPRPDTYNVFATHHRASSKAFLTDVFVFNATDGTLVEVVFGISYIKIPKLSMSKLLTRLTPSNMQASRAQVATASEEAPLESFVTVPAVTIPPQTGAETSGVKTPKQQKPKKQNKQSDFTLQVKTILADLSGLDLSEINDDSDLADLGIDSLMGMEMAHDIDAAFKITLPEDELMRVTDIPSLMKCVQSAVDETVGGFPKAVEDTESETSEDSYAKSDDPSISTRSDAETDVSSTAVEVESSCHQHELKLPPSAVMEAFNETKRLMDEKIVEDGQSEYVSKAMPLQTQMCISLTLDAFEQLGCPLRSASANQKFGRIEHPKEHRRLVEYLYQMLEREAQLINVDGDCVTRTAVQPPLKSSEENLQELLVRFPDQDTANKLTFYTGSNLAKVLTGQTDGIKLIFGTPEGRDLVSGLYGDWPLNRLFYKQMKDFLGRLVSKLDTSGDPLRILEMGAGTGGTTKWLVPLLATLNTPVEYTFTDLAPSFVAAARKTFKTYPFMKFRTHDIEKPPADDLAGTQHIIIASNAVHATHSLCESTKNMRKLLRSDGLLMMLEMTGQMYWVDMIFGLFEGWWFFDDGRTHAVTNELRWEKDLQSVGYGHVDWTDGQRPENKVEKLIIAMASGSRYGKLHTSQPAQGRSADCSSRQAVVDSYVRKMTAGFAASVEAALSVTIPKSSPKRKCVLVTGATGSLGSHLIAKLAHCPDVRGVICLNRHSKQEPRERQYIALTKRGILLEKDTFDRVAVYESDLSKPRLGLSANEYEHLIGNVTHVIHNAWSMNAKWPIKNFEPQLHIMRNLLDLTQEISNHRPLQEKVTFQFISSIATVGHRPLWTGKTNVPEERMTIDSVLPTGYGDAKYICELMLDETLHRYPDRFRAMTVRPGQIAGSSTSGYWNPMEHLSFLWKSSQTLHALPNLDGLLSWTPVDAVAGTLVDLLMLSEGKTTCPFYHIDNPIRQPWKEAIPVIADELDIPHQNIIPFVEWVKRVRDHPRVVEGPEGENPAYLLIDFLEDNFLRMSCGGLLLDTAKARNHSKTLRELGPVNEGVMRSFMASWKRMGVLK
ncbi:MAG: hypothetical protein Q9213_003866 [Squamulea squamosa]